MINAIMALTDDIGASPSQPEMETVKINGASFMRPEAYAQLFRGFLSTQVYPALSAALEKDHFVQGYGRDFVLVEPKIEISYPEGPASHPAYTPLIGIIVYSTYQQQISGILNPILEGFGYTQLVPSESSSTGTHMVLSSTRKSPV